MSKSTSLFPVILAAVGIFTCPDASALHLTDEWKDLPKEDKLLYANIGGALAITAWGFANWDYGKGSFHTDSEGWFGEDTKYGGADKMGHLYAGYVINRGLSYWYETWGYERDDAALYGAWSSFGLQTLMEVGDAFSGQYGFSHEDFIMNGVGSYLGYVLETHPNLDSKLDLRIEYEPSTDQGIDIFTDYEHTKYLAAIKLEGFEGIENKYLKYLEFHVGYYTRGFDDIKQDNDRNFYVGIGINLSRLFRQNNYHKTATFLEYFQIPYTDVQF